MSEEIVACPGCAKKFRIPEGAPPGSFACTACEADVPYGAPAAKGSPKGPARPAPAVARPAAAAAPARPAAAARPAPVAARTAPAASSRRAAPAAASSRRAARGHDDEAPQKKDNHGVIWGCIGVGGVAVIGLAYFLTKSKDTPKPTSPSTAQAPAAKPPAEKPKPAEAPKAEPAAPAAAATPAPAPKAEPPKPEETKPAAVKPEAAKPETATPEAAKPAVKGDFSALGQTFASIDGMSETDRAAADKFVTTAMDMGSGKDGSEAEARLVQLGKKAIPSILSAFSKQYTSGKWEKDPDQWSADKLQDLLHRITGSDGLNPKEEFYPRWNSGAPSEDFEKAANLWVKWWTSKGQFATKFKRASD